MPEFSDPWNVELLHQVELERDQDLLDQEDYVRGVCGEGGLQDCRDSKEGGVETRFLPREERAPGVQEARIEQLYHTEEVHIVGARRSPDLEGNRGRGRRAWRRCQEMNRATPPCQGGARCRRWKSAKLSRCSQTKSSEPETQKEGYQDRGSVRGLTFTCTQSYSASFTSALILLKE